MRKIKDVHDITFKSLMTNQKMAEDFFNEYLPANIKEVVDLSTLKLCSETYISEELEKSESDLLFSVNIRDKKGYIMLLPEHQSRADKWMALRIANYTCSIMHKHSKQYPNERLPLIIPVVFFHSKKAYPYSTDIRDLIEAPKKLIDSYLFKPFILIDTSRIKDEELKDQCWSNLMVFIFKHIFDRDIKPHIETIINLIKTIDKAGGNDIILTITNYISNVAESKDGAKVLELIADNVNKEIRGKVMTIAEQLIQKGKFEGIAQGKVEGRAEGEAAMLLRLLKIKFGDISEKYLKCIEKADADTLLNWGDNVLYAANIEEIFK